MQRKQPRYEIRWNDACLLGDTKAENEIVDTHTGTVVWRGAGQARTMWAEQEYSWGARS